MAIVDGAVGQLARDERHDGRFFDAVVSQCVELLPSVNDLGSGVLI